MQTHVVFASLCFSSLLFERPLTNMYLLIEITWPMITRNVDAMHPVRIFERNSSNIFAPAIYSSKISQIFEPQLKYSNAMFERIAPSFPPPDFLTLINFHTFNRNNKELLWYFFLCVCVCACVYIWIHICTCVWTCL